MRVKDAVGRFGEQVAADHLKSVGLTIVERNWRCRDGELDIVAREGTSLVFVEVKTRSSLAFGSPAEAVGHQKIARIRRLSVRWIDEHRACGPWWYSVRFDVISVVRSDRHPPSVQHLRSAF